MGNIFHFFHFDASLKHLETTLSVVPSNQHCQVKQQHHLDSWSVLRDQASPEPPVELILAVPRKVKQLQQL